MISACIPMRAWFKAVRKYIISYVVAANEHRRHCEAAIKQPTSIHAAIKQPPNSIQAAIAQPSHSIQATTDQPHIAFLQPPNSYQAPFEQQSSSHRPAFKQAPNTIQ
eukprot:9946545-Lingulodinium_polyedra.AAC.1